MIEDVKNNIGEYETLLLTQTKNLSLPEIKQMWYGEREHFAQQAKKVQFEPKSESLKIMAELGIK